MPFYSDKYSWVGYGDPEKWIATCTEVPMPDRVIEEQEVCVCGNIISPAGDFPGVCPQCGKIS